MHEFPCFYGNDAHAPTVVPRPFFPSPAKNGLGTRLGFDMRYYPRGKVIRHFPLSNPHICPTNPVEGGGGGGGGGVGPNIDRCINISDTVVSVTYPAVLASVLLKDSVNTY